jgi:uncharacterized protein (TIGR03437 family)
MLRPLLLTLLALPLTAATFGGSAKDSISSMALDASGNIWIVGTTFSADLPLINPFQATNKGTQLLSSNDSGATWTPLSSPQPNLAQGQTVQFAIDPTTPSTLYIGSANNICKSTDSGIHFACTALPSGTLTSLAIDPRQPATIYASLTSPAAIYKSTNAGQIWINSSLGIPISSLNSVVIDPFHSNVLYAFTSSGGYVSSDSGASWQISTLPWPSGAGFPSLQFTFDPLTPGTIYGPGFANSGLFIQKSSDFGKTWTKLNAPFVGCCVVADPVTPGTLYGGQGSLVFWKSTDGGTTWTSSSVPGGVVGAIAVDPANPQIILAGQYRSADGGKTWNPTNVFRSLQVAFSSGIAYALAPTTSDAFVAEFRPDGKTLVFASYFGGVGNETGNAIALDYAGNMWIAGTTDSTDLPVTSDAFQTILKGATNGFVAKISSDGRLLLATYLGGSKSDSALGIAVAPNGNPWVIGSWASPDFPFTTGAPPMPGPQNAALIELSSSAGQVIYATPLNGSFDPSGKGIAIDPSGNVTLTGSTGAKAFVLKLDSNGQQIYLQQFGGTHIPPIATNSGSLPEVENARSSGVAVAAGQDGSTYVTGTTSTADFPITGGAAQPVIGSGCTYPALTINTGLIGVLGEFMIDDSFVMKLGADGKVAYSTFVGGSCYDRPTSIAVDSSGNVAIAGETDSADYPLQAALEAAPPYRQFKSFVSTLNTAGSALTFSSYLYAGAEPTAILSNGSLLVAGTTGVGSQTVPDTGAYTTLPAPITDGVLKILQPPSVLPAANLAQVQNAFSLLPGPIAPGEIVSLGVPGFVPAQPLDIGINVLAPLTTNLGGVSVTFDGTPAYIMSISYGAIECIAPAAVAGQSSTAIQVNLNGALSNTITQPLAPTALGLYSTIRNPDGTVNSSTNPAPHGSRVTVFFTGAGVTSPPEPDGQVPVSSAIAPVSPILSNCSSTGALPGFVPGMFACQYQLPTNPAGTQYPAFLASDTSQSQQLAIYIK